MTLVLGIDTSTPIASVAVVDDTRVLALTHQHTRGSDLLVMIDAVCTGAAIGPRDLTAVAIGAGPGSFTGLRIGMATAKGIAFAAKCPLWAVSSLAALARGELFFDGADLSTVCAVLDARRGEVYAGVFARQDDTLVPLGAERVMPPGELPAFAAGARCVGDAGSAYPDLAALDAAWERTPSGADVARLALTGARADVLVAGAPAYIRKAEAEILYPDGVPGALRRR
jgi:tRNA threonylcarbamoyladenosine biosynthesis protein TsaB